MIAVDAKAVQDNIKHVMSVHGYSQAWLCEKTGIPSATISRYITGRHAPNLDYIVKIATAMDVSVDYLLGLTVSTKPGENVDPEIRSIINGYERADAHTKKMFWVMLEPFLTNDEKASAPQRFDEQKSEVI